MKISRFIAVAAAAVFSASIFCACGGGGGTSTTAAPQTTAAKAAETEAGKEAKEETRSFEFEGKYSFYAQEDLDSGDVILAKDEGVDAVMILEKGGTGTISTQSAGYTSGLAWEASDEYVTITVDDERGVYDGWISDGILNLTFEDNENTLLIFAQDGADTSIYDLMAETDMSESMESGEEGQQSGSRLDAVIRSMDSAAGIHMSFQIISDSTENYEAQYRDNGTVDFYYSIDTPQYKAAACYTGGVGYVLDTETMSGQVQPDVDPEDEFLMLLPLYTLIKEVEGRTDYREETREIDGVTYAAEVFPQSAGNQDAFLFTEDGELAYYLTELDYDPPEAYYTIIVNAMDTEIDESLFDVSGYDIKAAD